MAFITRFSLSGSRRSLRLVALGAASALLIPIVSIVGGNLTPASADSAPAAGVLPTVTNDVLPTVQINGVVWAQVTVGNTVYATGRFTSARPAGSPLGTNETPRANLLAFDITTGNLITSFNHALNAEGDAITASPDGKRVYVGGKFTAVDGAAHYRVVAINTADGSVVSTFTGGVGSATTSGNTVKTLTASNTSVYVGGSFQNSNTGVARSNLAQFTSAGALTAFAPKVSGSGGAVLSSVLTPDGSKLVFGGNFSLVNSTTYHALAAVNASTGVPVAWASTSATYPIRQDGSGSGAAVSSLSTDGTYIFMSMWNAVHGAVNSGLSEGRAAISPVNGNLVWVNDCHGDTYDAFPMNGVLYSVGHAHGCENIGGFPEIGGLTHTHHHALAEVIKPSGGKNVGPSNNYPTFAGLPDTTQLDWYPDFTAGTFTGISQAGWSVTGNGKYLSIGGEFPKVNGVAQQGLVRFGVTSVAPNKAGPTGYSTQFPITAAPANVNGQTRVNIATTYDRDNTKLTYSVYRDGGATPIYTGSANSTFWTLPTVSFVDSNLTPGSTHSYQLYVSDPFNNKIGPYYNLIDDNSTAIDYTGGAWTAQTGRAFNDYGNTAHYTTVNGATATLHFSGTAVSVVAEEFYNYGKMSISVDGGAPTVVDTVRAGDTRIVPQRVFTARSLTNGPHTIKVTKVDNTYIVLDGFLVVGNGSDVKVGAATAHTGSSTAINDSAAGITYAGGAWAYSTKRGLGDLNDDLHYSTVIGASATMRFNGSGIDVLMPKYVNYGTARVFMDGVLVAHTDEHSATRQGEQVTYSARNLTEGAHTIKIESTGGTYLCIDGFNIIS